MYSLHSSVHLYNALLVQRCTICVSSVMAIDYRRDGWTRTRKLRGGALSAPMDSTVKHFHPSLSHFSRFAFKYLS